MIVVCPSCATRYDLPRTPGPQGTMLRCQSCGFAWLEGSAIEIADATAYAAPAITAEQMAADPLTAIADRIAKAAQDAAKAKSIEERRKRASQRAWLMLAAAVALPLGFAWLFSDLVQDRFPRTQHVYASLGFDRPPAFEVGKVEQQNLIANGTRILAVKGDIINNTSGTRRAPGLRFALEDKTGRTVYAWTLPVITNRPLEAGETASFVTRVASPPLDAVSLKISFAPRDELALNAGHDGSSNRQPGSGNTVQ